MVVMKKWIQNISNPEEDAFLSELIEYKKHGNFAVKSKLNFNIYIYTNNFRPPLTS